MASQNDLHLNSDQAADTISATLTAHEQKFEELQRKWQNWQDRRQVIRSAIQTVEEIQIWQVCLFYLPHISSKLQVDTSELIGRLEQKTRQGGNSEQVHEEINRTLRTLPIYEQSQRLNDAYQVMQNAQQSNIHSNLHYSNNIYR